MDHRGHGVGVHGRGHAGRADAPGEAGGTSARGGGGGELVDGRSSRGDGGSRRSRVCTNVFGYILLLAAGTATEAQRPPRFDRTLYPETNLGNRTEGPGFLAVPRPNEHPLIRRILPPVIDPNEPVESVQERIDEARRGGWLRTDPYYRWAAGEDWAAAARWTQERSNEPIWPMVRFPERLQGVRVPQDDISSVFGRDELGPMYRGLGAYIDAITSDVDELRSRRLQPSGTWRTRSWWSRAAQTESMFEPTNVPEVNWLAILHRNHNHGPARHITYVPPRIYRPGQQEPGFPREVTPRRPWNEQADHALRSATRTEGFGAYDPVNTPRRELWDEPGSYAVRTRDRGEQTPIDYDPSAGHNQRYSYGRIRRVSGRLYLNMDTGEHLIAPADPRSRRRGVLYDRWLAFNAAAAVWWDHQLANTVARMRAHSDQRLQGGQVRFVAREPIGEGYSGDEDEVRTEPPQHAIIGWDPDTMEEDSTDVGEYDDEEPPDDEFDEGDDGPPIGPAEREAAGDWPELGEPPRADWPAPRDSDDDSDL